MTNIKVEEAEKIVSDDEDVKKDEDPRIRAHYYKNYPNDEDAKSDKDFDIRHLYYESHPQDKDAKNDEDLQIRYNYYRRHPEDKDVKYENAKCNKDLNIIRYLYYCKTPFKEEDVEYVEKDTR